MKLQTARQAKTEDPQQFADRCRALAQKIVCKVDDPIAQRIHHKNAERMLLATFVNGLSGTPGLQVRYANPQTVDQALKIALSVLEAERHERFSESFYTNFDKSVRLMSQSPSHTPRETADRGTQLTRVRSITHAVSEMVSTGQ
jgi:tRNA A37 N6-isopentenylltransferase MiaA